MKSKTVLITGAAKGIGAQTAAEFAKNGYNIILQYLSSDISKTENEIKKYGVSVKSVRADLTKAEDIKKLADIAINEFCGLDCLINNAGQMLYELFLDTNEEKWQRIFDINSKAPAMLTREILPHMISKQSGSIVNVSSVWGETGASMEVAYSASKAALIGFSKALAKEVAPMGIRVNAITPGATKTDMLSHLSDEEISELTEEIPLKKIASTEEIAKSIYFLASSEYITGIVLGVNGGINI